MINIKIYKMPPPVDINSKYRINELNTYYTKLINDNNNNKFIEELRSYLKEILKIEVTELEFWKFILNNCYLRANANANRFNPLILLLNEKNIFIEKYEDSDILKYIDIFTKDKFDSNSISQLSDDMIRKYQI